MEQQVESSFQSEASELSCQLINKEKEILQLKEGNKILQGTLNKWRKETEFIQENALEAEATIGKANIKIAELIKENNELKLDNSLTKKRASMAAEEKCKKTNHDLQHLQSKIVDLEKAVKNEKKENSELLKLQSEHKSLLECSIEKIIAGEKNCHQFKSVAAELNERLNKSSAIIIEGKEVQKKLEDALKVSNMKLEKVEAERNIQIADLQEQIDKKDKTYFELLKRSSTLKDLLKKNEENKVQVKHLKQQVEAISIKKAIEDNKVLNERITELENQNSRLNEQKKRLDSYIASLEDKSSTLEGQKGALEMQLQQEKLHRAISKRPSFKEKQLQCELNELVKILNQDKIRTIDIEEKNLLFSVKLKKAEETLVSMTELVTRLQAEVESKNLTMLDKINKLDGLEKLYENLKIEHEQCSEEDKTIQELVKLKSLYLQTTLELQAAKDETRLADEKCLDLSAQLIEQNECMNEKSSLDTKLQDAQEKIRAAEKKIEEMSTQFAEKENTCANLSEKVSDLQKIIESSNQKLQENNQKTIETETLNRELQNQINVTLAEKDQLKKELFVFYKAQCAIQQEKASSEVSVAAEIFENSITNIKDDFVDVKTKLTNAENLFQASKSYISALFSQCHQLRAVLNQEEAFIVELKKNPKSKVSDILESTYREQYKLIFNLGDMAANNYWENIHKFSATLNQIDGNKKSDSHSEESSKNSYADLQESVLKILTIAKIAEDKATENNETLSNLLLDLEKLSEKNNNQKTSLERTKKLLEHKIMENKKLQQEKELLESIVKKNAVLSEEENKKNIKIESSVLVENEELKCKIIQLEAKLQIAHEQQVYFSNTGFKQSPSSMAAWTAPINQEPLTPHHWQRSPRPHFHPVPQHSQQQYYNEYEAHGSEQFWSCKICGNQFYSQQELWQHSRTYHNKCPRIDAHQYYSNNTY